MIGPAAFRRADESADAIFYREPRFVEHIDVRAIAAVTQLYRENFAPGTTLLDLMSSWVSHLPPEMRYARVVGVGMNAAELARNPQLDETLVRDLNAEPHLPYAAATFDGVAICVSIQYLTRPVEVLADVARVMRAGAPLVVTFSNRCFPTKAIAAWHALDPRGHCELIARYLRDAGGFTGIVALDRSGAAGDPLYAVVARASGGESAVAQPTSHLHF